MSVLGAFQYEEKVRILESRCQGEEVVGQAKEMEEELRMAKEVRFHNLTSLASLTFVDAQARNAHGDGDIQVQSSESEKFAFLHILCLCSVSAIAELGFGKERNKDCAVTVGIGATAR